MNRADAILNLWAARATTSEICEALKLKDSDVIYALIVGRKHGDERAQRRDIKPTMLKQRAAFKNYLRRKLAEKYPCDVSALEAAIASYSGEIKQLPIGFHAGYWAKALKEIGL